MAQEQILARFYHHPVRDERGLYVDEVMVELKIKGDRNTTFSRPKKREDEVDYPNAWKLFLASNPENIKGTPLGALPFLTQSDILNLREKEVYTVEAVAELHEGEFEEISSGAMLLKRAKAYLYAMSLEDVPEEDDSDQGDWVDDQPQIAWPDKELVQPAQPRRRGRPRKNQVKA